MDTLTLIVIIAMIASFLFMLFTVSRVLKYNREYKLPESKYTKLFHILKKSHIVVAYIVANIAHIFLGLSLLALVS